MVESELSWQFKYEGISSSSPTAASKLISRTTAFRYSVRDAWDLSNGVELLVECAGDDRDFWSSWWSAGWLRPPAEQVQQGLLYAGSSSAFRTLARNLGRVVLKPASYYCGFKLISKGFAGLPPTHQTHYVPLGFEWFAIRHLIMKLLSRLVIKKLMVTDSAR